jgi:hypothetical protein
MNPVKIIVGFIPFLLFTLLSAWVPVGWSAAIGLAAAIVVIIITLRGGLKILPVVQSIILLVIMVLGFVGGPAIDSFLSEYARGGASVVLALFILTTSLFAPFTAQFARAGVPREFWHSRPFLALNRRMSAAWGAAILVVGICRIASAVMGTGVAPLLSFIIQWGFPIAAIYLAFSYTKRVATAATRRAGGNSSSVSTPPTSTNPNA